MNGFLPLIEAFLAFALTMLALATAVSALLGVWIRVFRWRSYGFRMSIKSIYDSQIRHRLEAALRSAPDERMRLEFVASMTFNLNEEVSIDGAKIREDRIKELERTLDRQDQNFLSFWARTWHSLRFGVDGMPESQYRMRLENSAAGKILAQWYGPDWPGVLDWLEGHFTEVGVVATESFRRRSSARTVVIGLFLAFAVNVDAFNLLNTYMSSEEARLSVIEQQEEILAMQVETSANAPPTVVTADQYRSKVDEAIGSIDSVADQLNALPDSDEKTALLKQLTDMRGDLEIASSAAGELETAIAETQSIAAGLVNRFPVGWDTFPNCSANGRDLRCMRIELTQEEIDAADKKWFGTSRLVFTKDPSGFLKWLLGVLITGLMVGLGAPFWVQVVDKIVAVRKVVTDAGGSDQTETGQGDDGSPGSEVATAPLPPAGGGAVARQAADRAVATPAATATKAGPNGGTNARQASDAAIIARQARANQPSPGST